jgi:superfamily II DNA or RNA helicase
MIIEVNHNICQMEYYHSGIESLLSYKQKEFKGYGPNKKFHITTVPLVKDDGSFYTGLLTRVMENFGSEITLKDLREFPDVSFEVPHLSEELRDYQLEYIIQALKMGRCLVKAPTSSGKTLLMAALITATNLKTLVLVPGIDLMHQIIEQFGILLNHSKSISNAVHHDPDILVTLPGRLKNVSRDALQTRPLFLMDEAHTGPGAQATDAILKCNAPFRFGFTATPIGRSDGRDLVTEGLFGPILELRDHKDLVEEGFLPDTEIDIYSSAFEGDYAYMEDLLIVNNHRRNQKIADLANAHTKRAKSEVVLILVRRVEHGKKLAEMIPNSVYIDGETPGEERVKVKEKAKEGIIRVLIATQIFAQGVDLPNITLGINASGGKSDILVAQRFGRVTRLYGGRLKRFVDFYDSYNMTLDKHSRIRCDIYRKKTSNIHLHGFSLERKKRLQEEFDL